ncbi:MAG: aminotransferase class I/II-fold pyridoxal phosphate-dependent enzyme [Planctomycetota bacterium]
MPPTPRQPLAGLHGYAPGEQPQSGTGGPAPEVVKLNTNESPYPPPSPAVRALREIDPETLRRYPSPDARPLREAAARRYGVSPDQVIATNGGDELLRLLITAYCEPARDEEPAEGASGGGLGVCEPTYSLYPVLAAIHHTPVVRAERDADSYALDPEATAAAWNAGGARLGFVVNPHAPSGRVEQMAVLEALAERFDGLLLVDEAYVDFAPGDALALVRQRDDVAVLRSMSKGYGLAGLRVGLGVAPTAVIELLHAIRDSYNVDAPAQAAAAAALGDEARPEFERNRDAVLSERDGLTGALTSRGWRVWSSGTNFVLARPAESGPDAAGVYAGLKDRGVLVRYFDHPGLADKVRITVGSPDQNAALLEGIDALSAVRAGRAVAR